MGTRNLVKEWDRLSEQFDAPPGRKAVRFSGTEVDGKKNGGSRLGLSLQKPDAARFDQAARRLWGSRDEAAICIAPQFDAVIGDEHGPVGHKFEGEA